MATLPTPPAAPVTITGPFAGATPCSSSAMTQSMAVYPAVPIAMACAREPFRQGYKPIAFDAGILRVAAKMRFAQAPAVEHDLIAGLEFGVGRGLDDARKVDAGHHRPASHHRGLACNGEAVLVIDRGVGHPDSNIAFHQIGLGKPRPGGSRSGFCFCQDESFKLFWHR